MPKTKITIAIFVAAISVLLLLSGCKLPANVSLGDAQSGVERLDAQRMIIHSNSENAALVKQVSGDEHMGKSIEQLRSDLKQAEADFGNLQDTHNRVVNRWWVDLGLKIEWFMQVFLFIYAIAGVVRVVAYFLPAGPVGSMLAAGSGLILQPVLWLMDYLWRRKELKNLGAA